MNDSEQIDIATSVALMMMLDERIHRTDRPMVFSRKAYTDLLERRGEDVDIAFRITDDEIAIKFVNGRALRAAGFAPVSADEFEPEDDEPPFGSPGSLAAAIIARAAEMVAKPDGALRCQWCDNLRTVADPPGLSCRRCVGRR